MSTILEALRKSEAERNEGTIPTLSDMKAPHEPQKWSHYLLLAIVVLLLVLIGFAVKFVMFPAPPLVAVSQPVAVQQEPVLQVENNKVSSPAVDIDESIEVNVVSYSESPEKRFVMIGGKLLRENEFVRAGLKVEQIRQDEVVFNLRGEQVIRRP